MTQQKETKYEYGLSSEALWEEVALSIKVWLREAGEKSRNKSFNLIECTGFRNLWYKRKGTSEW